jgi:hypothetical protein
MSRPALALTTLLVCISPALATLSAPPTPLPAADRLAVSLTTSVLKDKALSDAALQDLCPCARNDEYQVTSQTEVFVDGRSCRYADVPHGAAIVNMEVSSDDRTVLTIHFRSKK